MITLNIRSTSISSYMATNLYSIVFNYLNLFLCFIIIYFILFLAKYTLCHLCNWKKLLVMTYSVNILYTVVVV